MGSLEYGSEIELYGPIILLKIGSTIKPVNTLIFIEGGFTIYHNVPIGVLEGIG